MSSYSTRWETVFDSLTRVASGSWVHCSIRLQNLFTLCSWYGYVWYQIKFYMKFCSLPFLPFCNRAVLTGRRYVCISYSSKKFTTVMKLWTRKLWQNQMKKKYSIRLYLQFTYNLLILSIFNLIGWRPQSYCD